MALLYRQDQRFKDRVQEMLGQDFARQATAFATKGFIERKNQITQAIPEWEDLRQDASDIREHVLDHLDTYLATFVNQAQAHGSKVYAAQDASEVAEILKTIVADTGVKRLVKSKSMVSEEADMNRTLLDLGLEVTETDLGEWILQLADWDAPSHIIGPALHMDIQRIYDLFVQEGYQGPKEAYDMTKFARQVLREKFLQADIGLTGCNYAIAEDGATVLLTNEGNARMTTALPRTQIVIMGIERLLPDYQALDRMMEVFVRTAVGTHCSSYLSINRGPRRPGEADGPEEVHIILFDGGRSKILAGPYRDMLKCIRCGVCQNICPVYQTITGHAYGSIYEGPMGIVLTPLLAGYEKTADLPYASTLCGACSDHCPVKIPLHELILRHREDLVAQGYGTKAEQGLMEAAGQGLGSSRVYRAGMALARPLMRAFPFWKNTEGDFDASAPLPVLKDWTQSRNLPPLAKNGVRATLKAEKGGPHGDR